MSAQLAGRSVNFAICPENGRWPTVISSSVHVHGVYCYMYNIHCTHSTGVISALPLDSCSGEFYDMVVRK